MRKHTLPINVETITDKFEKIGLEVLSNAEKKISSYKATYGLTFASIIGFLSQFESAKYFELFIAFILIASCYLVLGAYLVFLIEIDSDKKQIFSHGRVNVYLESIENLMEGSSNFESINKKINDYCEYINYKLHISLNYYFSGILFFSFALVISLFK